MEKGYSEITAAEQIQKVAYSDGKGRNSWQRFIL